MKQQVISHPNIQIQDTLLKIRLYLTKINELKGSVSQIQKICHLTIETCLKYFQKDQYVKQIHEILDKALQQSKNYYILYIFDILLKHNKCLMRLLKKNLDEHFKSVWQVVWIEPNNELKLECLKVMVRTWGIIYSQKFQNDIKKWIFTKYNVKSVSLDKKYEEIFCYNVSCYKGNKPMQEGMGIQQHQQQPQHQINTVCN